MRTGENFCLANYLEQEVSTWPNTSRLSSSQFSSPNSVRYILALAHVLVKACALHGFVLKAAPNPSLSVPPDLRESLISPPRLHLQFTTWLTPPADPLPGRRTTPDSAFQFTRASIPSKLLSQRCLTNLTFCLGLVMLAQWRTR